jgi:hypothetical protein
MQFLGVVGIVHAEIGGNVTSNMAAVATILKTSALSDLNEIRRHGRGPKRIVQAEIGVT